MSALRRVRMACIVLAAVLGASCVVPLGRPVPATESPPVAAPPGGPSEEVAAGVLAEANAARRAESLPPLTPHPALNRAAADYALELSLRRLLDHNSPTRGRETMAARVAAVGVEWSMLAENLAQTSDARARAPRATIMMWLGSPGHRRNLLTGRFTHTGVGAAVDGYGRWYVVQLYAVLR